MESEDPWLHVNAAFVAGEIGHSGELTPSEVYYPTIKLSVKQSMPGFNQNDDDRDLLQQLKNLFRTSGKAGGAIKEVGMPEIRLIST